MKVTPVIGTPTLPNTPLSGLSPEKLARLKTIAAGGSAITVTEKEEDQEKSEPQRTITMRTNRTVDRGIAEAPPAEEPDVTQTATSDTDVQANETVEATQPLSPQLVALQKQRRALQVKERELLDKEKALAGPSRTELEERIKSNALGVLQEYGVTYDQLTEQILAAQSGVTPEIQALKAELEALKSGIDTKLSERDVQAERAVLTEMAGNIDRMIAQGSDFEMVREAKMGEEVLSRIHEHWQKTGQVRDELDVLTEVENELVEDAVRYARLQKVQGKLTPSEPLQPQPAPGIRTLTNKDSARPSMDRRQRAIQAALGNVKR